MHIAHGLYIKRAKSLYITRANVGQLSIFMNSTYNLSFILEFVTNTSLFCALNSFQCNVGNTYASSLITCNPMCNRIKLTCLLSIGSHMLLIQVNQCSRNASTFNGKRFKSCTSVSTTSAARKLFGRKKNE